MRGMATGTGKPISGLDHLIQSVADILGTPIGSRVMRRDYGSDLPDLIDQPMNGATRMRIFAAVATALQRWEPRIRLTRVWLERGARDGAFVLTLAGHRLDVPARSDLAAFDINLNLGARAQLA